MDFKVYHQSELGNEEPVEIGRGSKLMITTETGFAPGPPMHMGSYVKYENMNIKVLIEGWKSPAPLPVYLPTDDVQNMGLILTAIVRMLGGAVSISSHEIDEARKLTIEARHESIYDLLVLSVK